MEEEEEEERKEGKGVVNMTRIFCQKGNEKFWIDTFTKDVSIVVKVGVDSTLLWLSIVVSSTAASNDSRSTTATTIISKDNGHLSHQLRSLEKPVTQYFVTTKS